MSKRQDFILTAHNLANRYGPLSRNMDGGRNKISSENAYNKNEMQQGTNTEQYWKYSLLKQLHTIVKSMQKLQKGHLSNDVSLKLTQYARPLCFFGLTWFYVRMQAKTSSFRAYPLRHLHGAQNLIQTWRWRSGKKHKIRSNFQVLPLHRFFMELSFAPHLRRAHPNFNFVSQRVKIMLPGKTPLDEWPLRKNCTLKPKNPRKHCQITVPMDTLAWRISMDGQWVTL